MRRRIKVLTAILLSAAMTLSPVSAGFAGEIAAETAENPVAGNLEEQEPVTDADTGTEPAEASGIDEKGEENAGDADKEQTEKGSGTTEIKGDSDPEGESNEDAESQGETLKDQEGSEETAEISENSAEADSGAPGEVSGNVTAGSEEASAEADAELDEDTISVKLDHKYTHDYDGNKFTPGNYTVPNGAVLRDGPEYGGSRYKNVATAGQNYKLPEITTVSQSYCLYLYPTNATDNNAYSETITVKVLPRAVTYRSATYTKEYDGTPLSQNSAADKADPVLVDGTLVGNESFGFEFDKNAVNIGKPDTDTSVPNVFKLSENGTADLRNYKPIYEYGNLIVTALRNGVRNTPNLLPTPQKTKATVDNKGGIKVSWKGVKSYKENGKKGGKTTYDVYRYNDNGTWGEPIAKELKKMIFTDTKPSDGERLIYKIVAVGYDSSGKFGCSETPAYVRATPKIISASPFDGIRAVNVNFMGLGTADDEYILEHWNTKKKGAKEQITINKYKTESSKFEGKVRTISSNIYTDTGSPNVEISVNKAIMNFRIMAKETVVFDYGSKVTVPETKWSKTVKVKMVSVAPVLKGKRKSDSSFELTWNKIGKATGYLLEYSTDPKFSTINDVTKSMYMSKDKNTTTYNNRKYLVDNVGFGVPYYCRITAYSKKKGEGGYGTALGTSKVIVQYGRQEAVKDLKAEFFEDGFERCEAKLTWTDNNVNTSKDSNKKSTRGYYIQKWSFEYNPASKQYDKQTGYEVLSNYTSSNFINTTKTEQKYTNSTADRIKNGELIKYRVQSVFYEGGTAGEYFDGYVFSEPSDFYYMNPTEVKFTKKTYTVPKGGTLTPTWKFSPKKLPKKADDLTQAEFKKVFKLNDSVDFVLQSDSLTYSEIKKYVTVDGSTGKLTGVKTYSKKYINLRASATHDPNNVYATTTVCVGGEGSTSSESSEKKEKSTTKLTVCIDPGHGGKDDGATGNGITEKDMNLKIALKVGEYLEAKGAKVYYTRKDDKYVSLTDRTDYADEKDCNLFVSIHCNSSTDSSSNGTEVYYSVKSKYAKKKLAEEISSEVSGKLGTKNIGAKTRAGNDGDYYSVIRTSAAKGIPGLIVEHAFLSNSSDASKLKDKYDAAAKAEADAIWNTWNK